MSICDLVAIIWSCSIILIVESRCGHLPRCENVATVSLWIKDVVVDNIRGSLVVALEPLSGLGAALWSWIQCIVVDICSIGSTL